MKMTFNEFVKRFKELLLDWYKAFLMEFADVPTDASDMTFEEFAEELWFEIDEQFLVA